MRGGQEHSVLKNAGDENSQVWAAVEKIHAITRNGQSSADIYINKSTPVKCLALPIPRQDFTIRDVIGYRSSLLNVSKAHSKGYD